MNIVIFASDSKGLSSLNSIMQEADNAGINLWAMINQDTQLKYPLHHPDRYQILTNCKNINPYYSKTLGVELPFKPDWLIVNRERWEPETSIILEFKQEFDCKIGLIEPNSYILNNIETKLENYSKNRYINLISTYFVHSTHSKQQQSISGFEGNMVVVGNPKYDLNLNPDSETINKLKKYYKIDESKEQVLLFSLINRHRKDINKIFKKTIESNPDKQYFYKPYPGEPFDPMFKTNYYPNFFLKNCIPILEESHIWGMFNICDTHIGCISSITHATLILGKKYIDVSKELGIDKKYLEVNFSDDPSTSDIDAKMWIRSFNFSSTQQLKNLLPNTYINDIKNSNQKVWDNLDSHKKILTLFDDYNDKQAGKRIINYILNNEK